MGVTDRIMLIDLLTMEASVLHNIRLMNARENHTS